MEYESVILMISEVSMLISLFTENQEIYLSLTLAQMIIQISTKEKRLYFLGTIAILPIVPAQVINISFSFISNFLNSLNLLIEISI